MNVRQGPLPSGRRGLFPRTRRTAWGLVVGVAVALPATSRAGEDDDLILDLSEDSQIMPGSADADLAAPTPELEQRKEPSPYVVFLDLSGPTIVSGPADDATKNQSIFPDCAGKWPAYDDGMTPNAAAVAEALIQAVRQDWAPYNVRIVTTRPAQGPYVLSVVGKFNGCGPGAGYALQDCKGALNDVVFTKVSSGGTLSAGHESAVVSQEIGHALGLAHDNDPKSVFNPQIDSRSDGVYGIVDRCLIYSGLNCGPLGGCPSGQQNAHAYLMEVIGPNDGSDPVVPPPATTAGTTTGTTTGTGTTGPGPGTTTSGPVTSPTTGPGVMSTGGVTSTGQGSTSGAPTTATISTSGYTTASATVAPTTTTYGATPPYPADPNANEGCECSVGSAGWAWSSLPLWLFAGLQTRRRRGEA